MAKARPLTAQEHWARVAAWEAAIPAEARAAVAALQAHLRDRLRRETEGGTPLWSQKLARQQLDSDIEHMGGYLEQWLITFEIKFEDLHNDPTQP